MRGGLGRQEREGNEMGGRMEGRKEGRKEGQDAREVEDAGWRKDSWREVRQEGSGQSEETLIQMAFSIFELRPAASGQSRRQLKESEREGASSGGRNAT